jgi:ATP-dependent RNA helicase RhlB
MLSGDVNQNRRLRVLEDFREGKVRLVVATDVAGRGLHVDDIGFVINFDFPYEPEDYVHRIGRTGRAGASGTAISFADEDESFIIPDIEKYIGEELKCTVLHGDDPLLAKLPDSGRQEGHRGPRREREPRPAGGSDRAPAAQQQPAAQAEADAKPAAPAAPAPQGELLPPQEKAQPPAPAAAVRPEPPRAEKEAPSAPAAPAMNARSTQSAPEPRPERSPRAAAEAARSRSPCACRRPRAAPRSPRSGCPVKVWKVAGADALS